MSTIRRIPGIAGAVLALVLAGTSCETLNIGNPNAPDSKRALSDPATVQTIAAGAFRTWFMTSNGGFGEDQYPVLTLSVMARSYVAAWNNYNIRFYTGCTSGNWDVYTSATNGTCSTEQLGLTYPRIEWQNNSASAQRTQIEALWYGYYSALSSANDVLKAIRVNNIVISSDANTRMVETMALLAHGLALSGIALNYDQGFVVSYGTDLSTLTFSPAAAVRDSALADFDAAIALAGANTFEVPGNFFGSPGPTYSNTQIAQVANTMAARLLAYFPRSAAQNADVSAGGVVDWTRVAAYASNGISSGTPFDFTFFIDACNTWCDLYKGWSNDATTMRTHSRIGHLMDPASQPDPWNIALDTNPNSPDHRFGDGTFRGDPAYGAAILAAHPDTTGNGGYDFVWSGLKKEIQNKSRGAWHQSALAHVRYDSLTFCGDNPQGEAAGSGPDIFVLAAENDLLWAEALLRKPTPDAATAATLINYTRVGPDRLGRPRGGLTASTGTLADVQYEQDVELLGSNNVAFYNQRRIDKLEPLTPHEMPVPAKELGVLQQGAYTCGGAANPDGSCQAHAAVVAALVTDAPRVWADMQRQAWENLHHYGLKSIRVQ
jgi:starch-binding outer membrane protein, SusD/RagB family